MVCIPSYLISYPSASPFMLYGSLVWDLVLTRNQISLVMSATHTQGCFPCKASDTPNHLQHHTHTLWTVQINIFWTQMHRTIPTLPSDMAIAGPGAMKSCVAALFTHNKAADFPSLHLCRVLNWPTFLFSLYKAFPLLPWVPSLQPSPFPSHPHDLGRTPCRG